MFYGFLNLPWWGYLVTFLVFTQLTIMAVTLYLHRSQAHRAVDFHPILSHFFRFWLWATTGMETKAWTAIHRKHHAKCETAEDPHSPQILGLKTVFWTGAELYRKEATVTETKEKYGAGTPDDWMERNVYKHSSLGFYMLLVTEILLFGVPGIAIWAGQMMWIPLFAAGVVNGLGHYWGYRNFECADASTNLSPLGIFIGGEELHNNHHTYPTSAKFSIKAWEFDLGWFYLNLFKLLGLAKIKRVAPKVKTIPGKAIDVETVRQLINNRFEVMARFSKQVVIPTIKQERESFSPSDWTIFKKLKMAMMRDPSRVDSSVREKLNLVLVKNQSLNQINELRTKLISIWEKSSATPKELVEALQNWCREAESSGIKALRDFSKYIQSYSLTS